MTIVQKIIVILVVLHFSFCRFTKEPTLESNRQEQPYNDPICGENIIWHLHLQDGFEKDTIKFIVGKDTFPDFDLPDPFLIATSGGNDCTGIYFTCYKRENKPYVYLHYMPSYNTIREGVNVDNDSVNIRLLVNDMPIDFSASLVYNRFFGINYNDENGTIWAYKGNSCFTCW